MKKFVLPFKKINKNSVRQAGGKGANLGELTRTKVPVPPGFVVLADAFEEFLKDQDLHTEINATLKIVNVNDVNSVDRASNIITDVIRRAKVPKNIQDAIAEEHKKLGANWVAVRSSATAEDSKTASWAGELDTYLYVSKVEVVKMVKRCWSSLFTARAIFYRIEKKLQKKPVSVAVVVQKMVASEVSGVAFTTHPVTNDHSQMVIEAGWGLGEALVSGQITPDTYIVDKKKLTLIDAHLSEQSKMLIQKSSGGSGFAPVLKNKKSKQKLTVSQISQLAKLCKTIEHHYRHPQDIEWARAAGKWYILQTRPITTLQ